MLPDVTVNQKKRGGTALAFGCPLYFVLYSLLPDGEHGFYMFWIAVGQMCCVTVTNICLVLLLSCWLGTDTTGVYSTRTGVYSTHTGL